MNPSGVGHAFSSMFLGLAFLCVIALLPDVLAHVVGEMARGLCRLYESGMFILGEALSPKVPPKWTLSLFETGPSPFINQCI